MSPLAETGDFQLGPWRVRPSRSELESAGRSVRLEPRVMGVLVALARRPGATVARERLIEEVWDGRVVTDDAVQRCVAALRKVLRSHPGVDIETIPKLGYALRIATEAASAATPAPAHRLPRARRLAWSSLAVALALPFAALWWKSADLPAFSRPGVALPRARPLTALPGREVQPALSPSGGQVAFVWSGEDGSNRDIYVKATSADGLLRLTADPAPEERPAWSPDGGEIAFLRLADDRCSLFRVSALGGPERHVAECEPGQVRAFDWSPDGTRFAFAVAQDDLAPARLRLIDAGSGESEAIPAIDALQAGIEDARFSPDGRELAFSVGRALGVEDVHVYRFEDRTLRRLSFDGLKIHNLDWSADGRVVFSSNRGGPFQLWELAAGGGEPALVAGAGNGADDPSVAVTADGRRRIAYEVWREDAELARFSLTDASAAPTVFASSTRFEWDAQLSPDGRRLAFVSDRSGAAEIWIAARDGSQPQRLTAFSGAYAHSPRWSPDGARLAFVAPVSGRMNLFVMAAGDARPRRIGADDVDYLAPAWSADGGSLFVGGTRLEAGARDHAIWRVPADGAAPLRLDTPGARSAQLSQDGTQLYYTKVGEAGLWRRDLAGGLEQNILADLAPVDWNNWAVTPAAIFHVSRRAHAAPELVRVDARTRERRVLRSLPGLLHKSGLWISPDESELVATIVAKSEADLELLE